MADQVGRDTQSPGLAIETPGLVEIPGENRSLPHLVPLPFALLAQLQRIVGVHPGGSALRRASRIGRACSTPTSNRSSSAPALAASERIVRQSALASKKRHSRSSRRSGMTKLLRGQHQAVPASQQHGLVHRARPPRQADHRGGPSHPRRSERMAALARAQRHHTPRTGSLSLERQVAAQRRNSLYGPRIASSCSRGSNLSAHAPPR